MMTETKELTLDCKPGDLVKWKSFMSEEQGVLKEWDNGTAIVIVEGREQAVRCA